MTKNHLDQRQNLNILEGKLGYSFKKISHLVQALTHSSYNSEIANYQRYEFLGDSIVNLFIGEYVFKLRDQYNEGQLTRVRSKLVCESTLARIASDLDVGRFILLGPGELKTAGDRRPSILADVLEAITAAIYLDSDSLETTRSILLKIFAPYFDELSQIESLKKDSKSVLQEILQAKRYKLPSYAIFSITGKTHDQQFVMSCKVSELNLITKGIASTRRIAEQEAAKKMIEKINSLEPLE